MGLRYLVLAGLLILFWPSSARTQMRVLDCVQAASAVDRLICADPELAEAEAWLARAYATAQKVGPKPDDVARMRAQDAAEIERECGPRAGAASTERARRMAADCVFLRMVMAASSLDRKNRLSALMAEFTSGKRTRPPEPGEIERTMGGREAHDLRFGVSLREWMNLPVIQRELMIRTTMDGMRWVALDDGPNGLPGGTDQARSLGAIRVRRLMDCFKGKAISEWDRQLAQLARNGVAHDDPLSSGVMVVAYGLCR